MTKILISSFDPGKATGNVEGGYDTESGEITIVYRGVLSQEELIKSLKFDMANPLRNVEVHLVYESFELNSGNEFVADLHGVEVIGALKLAYSDPRFKVTARRRSDKAQVPDELLKKHGLWTTGSEVDWEDGRDVNDAMKHLIGYLCFDMKSRPALERFFK